MRNRLYIITLLSFVTMAANAQTFGNTYSPSECGYDAIQTQRIMTTGANYNGTVYEPFSSATPSEQSEVGANQSGAKGTVRKGFINPSDPGHQSNEFPIGEPWVMLLGALVFTGVIWLRRKQKEKPF